MQKKEPVTHYTIGNLSNISMAAEYKKVLPDEHVIAAEMEKARREPEACRLATGSGRPVASEVEDQEWEECGGGGIR